MSKRSEVKYYIRHPFVDDVIELHDGTFDTIIEMTIGHGYCMTKTAEHGYITSGELRNLKYDEGRDVFVLRRKQIRFK